MNVGLKTMVTMTKLYQINIQWLKTLIGLMD